MSNSSDGKNAIYWFVRRKIDNKLIGTANFIKQLIILENL